MKRTLLFVLALSACEWTDDRPIVWDRSRQVLGPIQLKNQVAYVDSALDRVTLGRAGGGRAARVGRLLGILGICMAASAAIALAVYGVLHAIE